jgi:hypothetical protein
LTRPALIFVKVSGPCVVKFFFEAKGEAHMSEHTLKSFNEELDSLKALFSSAPARVSFEFFPPKTPQMEEKLWESLQLLAPLRPAEESTCYSRGADYRSGGLRH